MCSIWTEANSLASAQTDVSHSRVKWFKQAMSMIFPRNFIFSSRQQNLIFRFDFRRGTFLICLVRLCLRSGGNNSHLEAVNCSAQRKKKTTSSGPGTTTGPLKWSVQRQKTVAESPVPGALYIFTYILKSDILRCSSSFCN